MRSSLEYADRLVASRDQDILYLNSRLAAKDATIAEATEHIDRLELQLETERADRSRTPTENSAPATDLSDKTGEIYNLVKPYLSSKAPKNLMAQIGQKLGED